MPGLAVILVGDDPASQVYVRNKIKACAEAGIRSLQETYPADLAEAELLARIAALNADDAVHGILVQMPLAEAHLGAARHRGDRRRARTSTATRSRAPAAWSPACPAFGRARRGAA